MALPQYEFTFSLVPSASESNSFISPLTFYCLIFASARPMEGIDSGFVHAIIDRFDSVGLEILEPALGAGGQTYIVIGHLGP